jgi:cytochrome P450
VHLAVGAGRHRYLGRKLGWEELSMTLNEFLAIPNIRLADAISPPVETIRSLARGIQHLTVEW